MAKKKTEDKPAEKAADKPAKAAKKPAAAPAASPPPPAPAPAVAEKKTAAKKGEKAAKGKAAPAAAAPAAPAAPKVKAKSKTTLIAELATKTSLDKKQVGTVLDELAALIKTELAANGTGEVILPGLLKMKRVSREATPEHEQDDRFNPGKKITVKAKPASTKIKLSPLKDLKDLTTA